MASESEPLKAGGTVTKKTEPRREYIGHLNSTRFVASLWVVCRHVFMSGWYPPMSRLFNRAFVAVNLFVVLSGFVTHWAYKNQTLRSSAGSVAAFYVKRIGRVMITTWLVMIWSIVIYHSYGGKPPPDPSLMVRCAFLVTMYELPGMSGAIPWCPNVPTWTIGSLMPSWLLYPFVHHVVLTWCREAVSSHLGRLALLFLLMFGLYLSILVPTSLYTDWFPVWYMFPPCMLPDFAIGCVAAEMVDACRKSCGTSRTSDAAKEEPSGESNRCGSFMLRVVAPVVSDLSVLGVLLAVLFLPAKDAVSDGGFQRLGFETVLVHLFAPVFGLFFVASTIAAGNEGLGQGIVLKLLSHKVLETLGNYSFVVYLFQDSLNSTFSRVFSEKWLQSPSLVFGFILSLYFLSGVYCELVEKHIVTGLRECTKGWAGAKKAEVGGLLASDKPPSYGAVQA